MSSAFMGGAASGAFAITPNDSTDLTTEARGIYVGGTGAVTLIGSDGATIAFSAVPAGAILPIIARRVLSTGTTATALVGFKS